MQQIRQSVTMHLVVFALVSGVLIGADRDTTSSSAKTVQTQAITQATSPS